MLDETSRTASISAGDGHAAEQSMIGRERWEEIRRLHFEQRFGISGIARMLDLDRKTVRRCVREHVRRGYRREPRGVTLLGPHQGFLRARAPQVGYSARILHQELRRECGFQGSYETVKRFVAPLRELDSALEGTQLRFETAAGVQSQIDWGEAKVNFHAGRRVVHFFVMTLGFSRRGFYYACADERLGQLLDAHERAFEHFGGHTREHLYDRARTVCYPDGEGRIVWNPTFKAFADYWGFEPRLCRPYRARTKGKVESGVKYLKRNFLRGRVFQDIVDLQRQLDQWNAEIADQRVHGTTHEPPILRFEQERGALIPTRGQPSFALAGRRSRIVASDYLVSFETHRYSVPFTLIGQTVEVERQGGHLVIFHRDRAVAHHVIPAGKHPLVQQPAHGPGAVARNARRRFAPPQGGVAGSVMDEVEIRDLALYEHLAHPPMTAAVAP
ncbi:MAG: IS21 family transposase [Steroidobacteraceae bacterium]